MTIDSFSIIPSAQAYKIVRKISKRKVNLVFKECTEKKIGRYVFEQIKIPFNLGADSAVYSIVVFKLENEPGFLSNTSLVEKKYGYILLVEFGGYMFVFKKHVETIDGKFGTDLSPLGYSTFSSFMAYENTEYERVAMNSMSISDAVIKSRAYEGRNLNGLLPSTSASRSIASNFRLSHSGDTYSVAPNTSRLTYRALKMGIGDLCSWCKSVSAELASNTAANQFILNFAAPVSLEEILKVSEPVAIFFNMEELDRRLREEEEGWQLMLMEEENLRAMTKGEVQLLLNVFRSPISLIKISSLGSSYYLNIKGAKKFAEIRFRKQVITFLSKIGEKFILRTNLGDEVSFTKFVNSEKGYSVVFDNPSYVYFSRFAFEDRKLLSNLDGLMSIFVDDYDFSHVISEKEEPHDIKLTEFPGSSLFHAVEAAFGVGGNIVVCDDLGDEWADHIIISSNSNPPQLLYVHSKFTNKESYGASKLHEVVSQALKNLGRINADVSDYQAKFDDKWNGTYVDTQISRVRSGHNWDEIKDALISINGNPNTIRKIILATPFFSKAALAERLHELAAGNVRKPAYTQVVWLINTFISACRDYGVQPYILCKP